MPLDQEKTAEHKPRLLEQVRDVLRYRHYSYRTEQSYIHWIKRYIYFHNKSIRGRWVRTKSLNI
jgi:hypothetical protein